MPNEPVAQFFKSSTFASIVGAVASAGVSFGILTTQQGDAVKGGLVILGTVTAGVITALPPILAAFHAKSKIAPTTPAAAPEVKGKHEAP